MSEELKTNGEEIYGGDQDVVKELIKSVENRREFVKKALKPAVDASKELEKSTATEKVRLQGTEETKVPNLKPYTESIDARDRKEIAPLIEAAKKENRPWKVVRSLKEGFRYTFMTKYMKEEVEEKPLDVEITNDSEIDAIKDEVNPMDVIPEEDKAEAVETEEQDVEKLSWLVSACVAKLLDEHKDDKEFDCASFFSGIGFTEEDLNKFVPGCEQEEKEDEVETIIIGGDEESEPSEDKSEETIEEEFKKYFVYLSSPAGTELIGSGTKEECEKIKADKDASWKQGDMWSTEITDKEQKEVNTWESLDEASSSMKKSFKNGGQDYTDLVIGRAIARIKDPKAREAAVAAKKAGREDAVQDFTGDRKENQAERSIEKKMQKMQDAGMTDESLTEGIVLHEEETTVSDDLEIKLDDLEFFKPCAGARDTWQVIVDNNKVGELAKVLGDFAKDGKMTTSDLNDTLWFEKEWVYDVLNINPNAPKIKSGDDVIEVEVDEIQPEGDK